MIAAITGGTGFIGKKLVARLVERGDIVRLLTRRPLSIQKHPLVEVYKCDLLTARTDELSTVLQGVDVLYHCAGEIKDENAMNSLHVDATRNLIDAATDRIDRWVQLSSVGAYGQKRDGVFTEESALKPCGIYEETKVKSDVLVEAAASSGAFHHVILRPSNVYGAEMTNQSLFSLILMIHRGLFFYIGKPGASANYIHVNNVVEGLIRCGTIQHAQERIYNLSDYSTLEYLVEVIADSLGCTSPWLRIPEPIAYWTGKTLGKIPGFPLTQSRVDALVNRSIYSISRIQQELGYKHIISMEEGLRELVGVYKQRILCRDRQ